VIAIVDLERIMQESVAYQKAAAQIEKIRQQTSDDLRQRENELRDAEQELSRQQRLVSGEQFDQKRRDFQRQVGEAQQYAQTKKRDLDTVSNGAMNQIRTTIVQVVGEISRERGINMVLPRAAVVLESPAFDVSNEVITRLNQKLPSVTVAAAPTTAKPAAQPQKPAAQGQAPKK
jgi:Skp family chaperone for outer membrane proteins